MFGLYSEWYRSGWNVLHTLWSEDAAGMKPASLHVLMFLSFSLRAYERLRFNTFAPSIEPLPYSRPARALNIRCWCCEIAGNTSEQIVQEVEKEACRRLSGLIKILEFSFREGTPPRRSVGAPGQVVNTLLHS